MNLRSSSGVPALTEVAQFETAIAKHSAKLLMCKPVQCECGRATLSCIERQQAGIIRICTISHPASKRRVGANPPIPPEKANQTPAITPTPAPVRGPPALCAALVHPIPNLIPSPSHPSHPGPARGPLRPPVGRAAPPAPSRLLCGLGDSPTPTSHARASGALGPHRQPTARGFACPMSTAQIHPSNPTPTQHRRPVARQSGKSRFTHSSRKPTPLGPAWLPVPECPQPTP